MPDAARETRNLRFQTLGIRVSMILCSGTRVYGPSEVEMDTNLIIAAIDEDIVQLRKARALLSGVTSAAPANLTVTPASKPARRRRRLSSEARKRIADAQKKRWAAVRAAKAGKKSSAAKKVNKEASVEKVAIKKPAGKKPARRTPAGKAAVAKKASAKAAKKAASVPAQASGAALPEAAAS